MGSNDTNGALEKYLSKFEVMIDLERQQRVQALCQKMFDFEPVDPYVSWSGFLQAFLKRMEVGYDVAVFEKGQSFTWGIMGKTAASVFTRAWQSGTEQPHDWHKTCLFFGH